MNPKYQKVLSDIEKAEKKKTELENLEIVNTIRALCMDKEQIMAFLSDMKSGKPSRAAASIEQEVSEND